MTKTISITLCPLLMLHIKFDLIGQVVSEKGMFENNGHICFNIASGQRHILVWRPTWSCEIDHFLKFCSPSPWRLHRQFGFNYIGQAVKKIFEKCGRRTTTDAESWIYYKLTW